MSLLKASIERRTLEAVYDEIKIKYPPKRRTKQTTEILELIDLMRIRGALNG
jgi:hypothetical protein